MAKGLPVISVQGLNEVQTALFRMQLSDDKVMKEVGKESADVATEEVKNRVGVDTGALRASIRARKSIDIPTVVQYTVQVGDPSVRRGEGAFEYDRSGKKSSILATSEYAAAHDQDTGFMQRAFDLFDQRIPGLIDRAVRRLLHGI